MLKIKDILLIRKFKLLNAEHLIVKNNFGINYFLWSDLPLDELNIPEGLKLESHLFGPEPGFVEYYVYNDKGINIGVLDSSPLKKSKTK